MKGRLLILQQFQLCLQSKDGDPWGRGYCFKISIHNGRIGYVLLYSNLICAMKRGLKSNEIQSHTRSLIMATHEKNNMDRAKEKRDKLEEIGEKISMMTSLMKRKVKLKM